MLGARATPDEVVADKKSTGLAASVTGESIGSKSQASAALPEAGAEAIAAAPRRSSLAAAD